MAEKYSGVEKYIFADTYNLFIKYKDIHRKDDKAWERLISDATKIYHKYNNHPLVRHMVSAVIENIEFKSCERVIDGKTYCDYEKELKDVKNIGF